MSRHKLINWFLIFLILIFGISVIQSYIRISHRSEIVNSTYDRLQKVKDENQLLKRKLAEVESSQYIEREARNKLNLGKDGEIALIIPSISVGPKSSITSPDKTPNWEKWLKIFL